jgi:Protein of unknown function (DUF1579)
MSYENGCGDSHPCWHSLSHGETSLHPSPNSRAKNMSHNAIATKVQFPQPPLTPSAEHQLLNAFVGKWHLEGLSYGSGQSKENPYDSSVRWSGEESYEWLPGGFFLVNHFNAQIGDAAINGMEIIGYDAASQTYPSSLFDNYGRIYLGQRIIRDGVWTYTVEDYRTTYVLSNDGNTMTTHWDWLSGADWLCLAELKGTKLN